MKRSCVLLLFAPLVLAPLAPAEVVERVVARVGGDIITLSEFGARQVAAAQAARVGADGVEGFLRQNNARILQDAIDELLIVQRASDLGLRLRPEYIDEVIDGIKKDNKIETPEDFSERLRSEGLTLNDLKRNIERSILRQQVLRKDLEPRVTVADAEARADYDARKSEYTKPATVHLQEMLVAPSTAEGEAKAKEIVAAIRGGADFPDLARKNSVSPTKDAGGDLGDVATTDMAVELVTASAKLRPGEVSNPIFTSGGWRIVRVVERKDEAVVPFDDVRAEIQKKLMQAKWTVEYDKYIAGLRAAAQPETQVMVREVPTELSVAPTGPGLSGAPQPPGTVPADPNAEIQTTPQAEPERVTPPAAPEPPAPTPAPTPTPTPTPTPAPNPR